jgi:hypothetical protein
MLEGLREIPALLLHYILVNVSALATRSETAPGSCVWKHHKSRGPCVGMERAETGKVLARFLQLYRFANHLGDVDPLFNFFDFIHLSIDCFPEYSASR